MKIVFIIASIILVLAIFLMLKGSKNSIIAGFALIFLDIIFIISGLIYVEKHNNENSNLNYANKNFVHLPDLETIDPHTSPLLYDFVNGSLGYCYLDDPTMFTEYGNFYAIMRNKYYKDTIFISFYSYADNPILPILGNEPVKETHFNVDNFESLASKMESRRIYEEGNWEMYVISLYGDVNSSSNCDLNGNWCGLHMSNYNSEPGNMYEKIYGGYGWPTEWLRREPFATSIKNDGINITNEFFDKYNIFSILKYENNEGEPLDIKVVNLERFQLNYNNETVEIVGEDHLNMFLNEFNYEIRR